MEKLIDICEEIKDGDWIESKDQDVKGIRLVQTGNIGAGFYLPKNDKAKYISEDTLNKLNCMEIFPNDILISRLPSPVGRACIFPDIGERAITAVDCTIIRVNKNICLPEFLVYFTMSDLYSRQIDKFVVGTTRLRISRKNLENIEINLPRLGVQEQIVEILDKAQELIDKRKAQIEDLDELVKSRFIEMFGNVNTNSKGWKLESMNKLINVIGGYAFRSTDFVDEGIPVLKIGNINAGYFKNTNLMFWKKDNKLEKYLIKPGDLVISLTGTVGKNDYGNVCIMGNDYDEYYLNQRNAKLEIKNSSYLNKYYLTYLLKIPEIKKRLTGISRGVRQANIANKDILNLEVPNPSIELQNQFASFVKQVDKLKSDMEQSLKELEDNFNSLMQRAFKGELFDE